jgi:hypothetical protein
MPKMKNFPLFSEATRHLVNLEKGDCVFIPAFEYFQISGNNIKTSAQALFNNARPKQGDKKIATVISLHFQANSRLLSGFMDAVERRILK